MSECLAFSTGLVVGSDPESGTEYNGTLWAPLPRSKEDRPCNHRRYPELLDLFTGGVFPSDTPEGLFHDDIQG